MTVVDKHITLNRQTAQQSIVLIKNTNNFLPIDFTKFKTVAIVGPCADDPDCSRGMKIINNIYNCVNNNYCYY